MAKKSSARKSKRSGLRLSAPKKFIFLISLLLAIIAAIAVAVPVMFILPHAFWMAIIAYLLLALGVALKGI